MLAIIIGLTAAAFVYMGINDTSGFDWYNVAMPATAGFYAIAWHAVCIAQWAQAHFRVAPSLSFFSHNVFFSYSLVTVLVLYVCVLDYCDGYSEYRISTFDPLLWLAVFALVVLYLVVLYIIAIFHGGSIEWGYVQRLLQVVLADSPVCVSPCVVVFE